MGDITGKCYSVKLPYTRFRYTKGFWLLVTDADEEYVIEKHFSIGHGCPLAVYQTETSLRDYIVEPHSLWEAEQKNSTSGRVWLYLVAVAIGRLILHFIPQGWVFGADNVPFHLATGLINLSKVLFGLLVLSWFLRQYRLCQLGRFLGRLGNELQCVGRVQWKRYDQQLHLGSIFPWQFWGQLFFLVALGMFFLGLTLIVAYRLFFCVVAVIYVSLFYRGIPLTNRFQENQTFQIRKKMESKL